MEDGLVTGALLFRGGIMTLISTFRAFAEEIDAVAVVGGVRQRRPVTERLWRMNVVHEEDAKIKLKVFFQVRKENTVYTRIRSFVKICHE